MVISVTGKKKWKTGELAKLTGYTIRTLLYYDQIELFSPSDYSEAGYRLYNVTDLSRLQQILSLKDLGLTLEEIKSILADDTYNPIEVVTLQIERLRGDGKNSFFLGPLVKLANRANIYWNHLFPSPFVSYPSISSPYSFFL